MRIDTSGFETTVDLVPTPQSEPVLVIQPTRGWASFRLRAGDIRHCFAGSNKLRDFRYEPGVGFEAGTAELVAWVRSQTAADGFERAKLELAARGLAQ